MTFTDLDAEKGWLKNSKWGGHSYEYITKNFGKWFEKQQPKIDQYAQRERARLQREEDQKRADERYKQELDYRREQDATNRANRQADLDFRNRQAESDQKFRQSQLQFQRRQASAQLSYQSKKDAADALRFDRQLAQQAAQHTSLLNFNKQRAAVEDKRYDADSLERKRQFDQTQLNFTKQLDAENKRHAENLQFQKDQASEFKKEKAKADSFNESATRNQVLASRGYGVEDKETLQSPIEKLLLRTGTGNRSRRLQFA